MSAGSSPLMKGTRIFTIFIRVHPSACFRGRSGRRELAAAGDAAIFQVGDVVVYQGVAQDIGDAKGVGARSQAVGFDEIIPQLAGHGLKGAVGELHF